MESQVNDKSNQDNSRLAIECARLDPQVEQALAEEGVAQDAVTWPTYLTAKEMRGFLKGINTAVERDPDRV